MTALSIARRLLEADEDFDPVADIKRYTASKYPGIEVESAFHHWDVYKTDRSGRHVIGSIYYDDMEDAPVEVMSPEARQFHEAHRWTAVPMTPRLEPTAHKTFEEALAAIVLPLQEGAEGVDDPDDPSVNIERFAAERNKPVAKYITNREGKEFKIRIVWDKPAGGTSYDSKGRVVHERLQPTVEFYDMTHADDPAYPTFKGKGQFISSYYASTLVDRRPQTGLSLYGGEPAWQIDWRTMDDLIAWIKQEVEGHGYKLKDDLFGKTYEGIDPDDPELYAHPERFDKQPSDEKIEGALRRMLAPYYTRVSISKRPGMFSGRALTQKNIPDHPGVVNRVPFEDSFIWTIHCHRDTPLPLSIANRNLPGYNLDWRQEVKRWFEKWAAHSNLSLLKFEIYGRLRKDPTFQFETARLGPLKENEEDLTPEDYVSHIVDTGEASSELAHDLWKFHPYGVGYNALLSYRGGFVSVQTYFPPEKDNFIMRFQDFVLNWVKEHKVMTVTHHKLTAWKMEGPPYPRWGIMLALNSDWPPDQAAYVPPSVEVGEPGVLPGGPDAPQV